MTPVHLPPLPDRKRDADRRQHAATAGRNKPASAPSALRSARSALNRGTNAMTGITGEAHNAKRRRHPIETPIPPNKTPRAPGHCVSIQNNTGRFIGKRHGAAARIAGIPARHAMSILLSWLVVKPRTTDKPETIRRSVSDCRLLSFALPVCQTVPRKTGMLDPACQWLPAPQANSCSPARDR
jgi:hypothetical protein